MGAGLHLDIAKVAKIMQVGAKYTDRVLMQNTLYTDTDIDQTPLQSLHSETIQTVVVSECL